MPVYAYILYLHAFLIVWGLHAAMYSGRETQFDSLINITIAFVVVMACARDAMIRKYALPGGIKFAMLFTWPISAPVYVIWSRGLRGIGWALLWSFTLYGSFALSALGLYQFLVWRLNS